VTEGCCLPFKLALSVLLIDSAAWSATAITWLVIWSGKNQCVRCSKTLLQQYPSVLNWDCWL